MKLQLTRGIPYFNNNILSDDEITSVSCYHDVEAQPLHWDYPISEKPFGIRMECFLINNYLRKSLKFPLTKHDKDKLDCLIPNIASAIDNSTLLHPLRVIKGLTNPDWLLKLDPNEPYVDDAFGSFTTSIDIAVKYAIDKKIEEENRLHKKHDNQAVFIIQDLKPNDKALYINDSEYEWLLPKNREYIITDIREGYLPNDWSSLTYYIEKVNK
ncbi:MAG TPA: hypothetical protein O0X70_06980 [Methanocorpusculum sp.]|nr:hypothetical protein [Methanocorpusculum sp.]